MLFIVVLNLHTGIIDGCFVAGGCSLDIPGYEAKDGLEILVRAFHYPGCIVVRPIPGGAKDVCTVQWLLECDYGGLVPNLLVNSILPLGQVLCNILYRVFFTTFLGNREH